MDFYVDVHDSVNLSDSKISHIPFKFGVIDNDFCIDNNLLTNCESLPQIVKKDFSMHNNKIENFLDNLPALKRRGFPLWAFFVQNG